MRQFILKYLYQFFDEVSPKQFYREIFEPGELAEWGNPTTGKYNAIAVELLDRTETVQARRHIITDDLNRLDHLLKSDNFIIISPISYAGKSRSSENARFIYAIAIDFDGITEDHYLRDLFFQIDNGVLPKPTFTVFSGSGLHLYYHLDQPIPCYSAYIQELSNLKRALTRKLWNRYTTELYNKPQIESLFQGFRMVGGITKDKTQRTRAFRTGDRVSLEYLNSFVEEQHRTQSIKKRSRLTLSEAQKKYPEWYERRIVEDQPKGTWKCKPDLFYWWIRQIKAGAVVGHRYYCIMCLAVYAKKAGITYSELMRIALDLVDPLDKLTNDPTNHFTPDDVMSALEAYNDNYITFSIDTISSLTNIKIEKNKRNYRKQSLHLKLARANKAILKEAGEMKPEGRPSRREEVQEWKRNNPLGSKADCVRETGISKATVYRNWD